METLLLVSAGLLITVCGLLLVQLYRASINAGQVQGRFTALDEKLGVLAEAALNVRDVKSATDQSSRDLAEVRGRLATLADSQANVSERLVELQSVLPLQVSDGLRSIHEGLDKRHVALRTEINDRDDRIVLTIGEKIGSGARNTNESLAQIRSEISNTLTSGGAALEKKMEDLRTVADTKLSEIVSRTNEGAQALHDTAQRTVGIVTDRVNELKTCVDTSLKQELGAIRNENSAKLEEIRRTVDEKLHETLERRLGASFQLVSDRLETVHRGLGEMQALASGVGDLKRILSNVKARGTWGEVQLEALLEQVLTADQYAKNVQTWPGSTCRVEFAIRLPGRDDSMDVWLPIDAKFPLEDYHKLIDAQDAADLAGIEQAGKALELRIKQEAKAIRDRYVDPPHTTDFAVLYLPVEGLYAEVLRRPGLADWVQRECKIVLAGPTTFAALLNSLQMGFRTLAIEKRSAEVWTILAAVKSEFGKFGDALAHTKKKLEEATNSLETAEQRNRVLTRKLNVVDAVPECDTPILVDQPAASENRPAA